MSEIDKLGMRIAWSQGLLEGTLQRCPLRLGSTDRECSITHGACMYGISSTTIPEECPLNQGSLIIKIKKEG